MPPRGALAHHMAVVASLLRKDLRAVLPLLLGFGVLSVLGTVQEAVLRPPSSAIWVSPDTFSSGHGLGAVIVCLITALLAALVLLAGERDTRTAEFVATLPVSPLTVVSCKFLVITALTAAVVVYSLLSDFVLTAALNPESLAKRSLTLPSLGWRLGLFSLLALVCAAHAVWLSSFGRLAWVILAVGTLGTAVIAEMSPLLAPLRLDSLVRVEHHGSVPLLPVRALWLQGGLGLLGLFLGMRRWVHAHGVPPHRAAVVEGPRRTRLGPSLAVVGLMMLAGLTVIIVRYADQEAADADQGDGGDDDDEEAAAITSQPLGTRHFVFTFLPEDREKAAGLASGADDLYRRLARWFGAEVPERILVDLTFSGVDAAGMALGYQLNLDVTEERSPEEVRHIFLHELAHVFETALAPRARLEQRASLRFLTEGMAEHVAFEVAGREDEQRRAQVEAAWARQRYKLRLRDLFDTGRLVTVYDERWLYSFGERWMAALHATCGREAPARLFRRLDDPALPGRLLGIELARHALAQDRCDFDQVEAAFEANLTAAGPALAELPRFRVRYRSQDRGIFSFDVLVETKTNPTTPVPMIVVLRADPGTSPREYVVARRDVLPGAVRRLTVAASDLDGSAFQYRVGLAVTKGGHHFTRWRSAHRE